MFKIFKNSPERQVESEKPLRTEIKVEIFRHSKRENDLNRPNRELLLTPEGRELAHEKGAKFNPNIEVAVAGASSMDRAAETAMLFMTAGRDEIEIEDSLEEMNQKVAEELKVGKKLYRDDRLGFNLDGPIHNEGMAAFKSGRYMEWLVDDSDQQAINKGDKISTSYLRQAGNIAELVNRYQNIGNNFNRLANNKQAEDKNFPDHLERYLATHQGVAECFVAEALKEEMGDEAKGSFIKSLGNGWAEMEGISLRIVNEGKEQSLILSYPDHGSSQEIKIQSETINTIIKRRADFEKAILEKDKTKKDVNHLHASDIDKKTIAGKPLENLYGGYLGSEEIASYVAESCQEKEVAAYLEKHKGSQDILKVLEVGAGTGIVGKNFTKHLHDQNFNIELTISDRNFESLADSLDEDSLPFKINKLVLDNKDLSNHASQVDFVVGRSFSHYEKDYADELKVFQEIYKTLKPGGFFINQAAGMPTEEEARLGRNIQELTGRVLNFHTPDYTETMLKEVFGEKNVSRALKQPPKIHQDKTDFVNRFKADDSLNTDVLSKKIKGMIEALPEKDRPSFQINGESFSWDAVFTIFVCKK